MSPPLTSGSRPRPQFGTQMPGAGAVHPIRSIAVRNEIAEPYFTHPNVPAARLDVLRRAFDKAIFDPEFVAES